MNESTNNLNDLADIMNMPFVWVCTCLQNRMAAEKTTEAFIEIKFKDMQFKLTATSNEVPQTFDEYMEEELKKVEEELNAESP